MLLHLLGVEERCAQRRLLGEPGRDGAWRLAVMIEHGLRDALVEPGGIFTGDTSRARKGLQSGSG